MLRITRIASVLLLAAVVPGLTLGVLRLPDPRAVAQGVLEASVASSPDTLTAHFIDVGQGDAVLIVSPDGRAVLVDGGPRAGGSAVLEVMQEEEIDGLDLVIATHPHLDHIGGLQTVIETVPVRYYMDPGFPHGSRAYERLLSTLESLEIPVLTGRAGRTINLGGEAVIEILAPEEPLHRGTRSDVNANSVIARLEMGGFSILLTGDAEAETESRLLRLPSIESTVLKVPHHGSGHSSTGPFLEAVLPEVAVIQVGATNSYGHPHPDTLERLEAVGARILRNDLHGTITITTDGKSYTISTERSTAATAERRSAGAAGDGEGASGWQRGPPPSP